MLPAVAEAAVDLHGRVRRVQVRLRAGHGGHARRQRQLRARREVRSGVGGGLGRGGGRVDGGARGLQRAQHVRAHVLDGLERADGPAELLARAGVRDAQLQAARGPADLLGGQGDGGDVHEPGHARLDARRAQRGGRHAVERHGGHGTGQVQHVPLGTSQSRRVAVHREQRHPISGVRDDEEQPGHVPIEHEGNGTAHRPPSPIPLRTERHRRVRGGRGGGRPHVWRGRRRGAGAPLRIGGPEGQPGGGRGWAGGGSGARLRTRGR